MQWTRHRHQIRTLGHDLQKPVTAQSRTAVQADNVRLSNCGGMNCRLYMRGAQGLGTGVIVTCVLTVTELPDVTPRIMTWSLPTFAPWAMPEMYELCTRAYRNYYAALALNLALNFDLSIQSLASSAESHCCRNTFNSSKGQDIAECPVTILTDTINALSRECPFLALESKSHLQ